MKPPVYYTTDKKYKYIIRTCWLFPFFLQHDRQLSYDSTPSMEKVAPADILIFTENERGDSRYKETVNCNGSILTIHSL